MFTGYKRMEKQNQFLNEILVEDMELPQEIKTVLAFKRELAQMLIVYPNAVAQAANVGAEKGLSRDSSIKS
ncbi:hypothetical protein TNCT_693311 [Trichonephila clavata]|uniref:Uncharacterized protein n=1 Tax=Trichonephila clavata TaxID=2740835 RepID=A0A8X6H8A9_TRICU|nr:hypothetical protein TNCT_693311 [Trichonephila clavata]